MKRQNIVSYAQNREDMILSGFLKDISGFYVDVGAGDPAKDSVTKHFYDKGWSGVNIEPNGRLFRSLKDQRPRDINLQIGISDKPGKLTMREYDGWYSGLSTFSKEMQAENKAVKKYRDIEVDATTLEKIFDQYKIKNIDFMKVDVEGFEYNVLKGNNWTKYRPKIICLEANHKVQDWRPILKNADYFKIFYDGLNEYYVSVEAKEIAKNFSYTESLIGKPIISAELNKQFIEIEERANKDKASLEFYKTENSRLNVELAESKMILPLLKQLAKTLDAGMRRRISALNNRGSSMHLETYVPPLNNNIEQRLASIKQYDFKAYYTDKLQKDRLAYVIVEGVYSSFARAVFSLGKSFYRLMKRVRK